MNTIQLNFHVYPLVVGQVDKYLFEDWEKEGGTILLTASVGGETYTQKDVAWSTSNPQVAVVENGLVQARTTGIADILAVLPDGTSDSCRIQVIDNFGRLTAREVTLNTDRLVLNVQEGAALYPYILPVDYYQNGILDSAFQWESSDESIVQVNHRGRVLAKMPGTATITATSADVGRCVSCQVTVIKKDKAQLFADPLEDMEGGEYCLRSQESISLQLPESVAHQPVCWCSENPQIASVDATGQVTAYKAGTVPVWATFVHGGWRVRYTLAVKSIPAHPICEVHISKSQCSLNIGEQQSLYAIVYPATRLEQPLSWTSSDESVLRIVKQHVNLSGLDEVLVEGVSGGTAVITGICDNRGYDKEYYGDAYPETYTVSCQVTVGAQSEIARTVQEEDDMTEQAINHTLPTKEQLEQSPYLANLHIPVETIREDSVLLMWNRKASTCCQELEYYEISQNGQLLDTTRQLHYRVTALCPESVYIFTVTAVGKQQDTPDAQPSVLASAEVLVETRTQTTTVLDVTKAPYYAVGNGIASDTRAIQRAIDDCPEGGEVLLPKGYVFCAGALFLKSNMTFRVDGILFGSDDPGEYPPIVCRWEGYRMLRLTEENQKATTMVLEENTYSHASLINVGVYDEGEAGKISPYHTFDVNICGQGMINGNGFSLSYNEGPCWYTHRKGLPVPQSPKRDQNVRGRVLAFYNTKRAYVWDVTVAYGPSWTIHPVFSDSITFDNVKVITMGNGRIGTMEGMLILNGDGIDPDSSTNICVVGSYFTTGDDAMAIKSGRNRQGYALGKPSAFIRVSDCQCVDAKGSFAIGSESAGGVHDVLFQNLSVKHLTNFGLWIKSAPSRGGVVENIAFMDCQVEDTGGAMQIEYNHGGNEDPSLVLPITRNISYENIVFRGEHKFGIRIIGHPDSLITDVSFKDCSFEDFVAKKDRKFVLENCENIELINSPIPEEYCWEGNGAAKRKSNP